MPAMFTCNICGQANRAEQLHRELLICSGCGSNARFRAVMMGLSQGLFGNAVSLPQMTPHRQIRGFGCSDGASYADRLSKLFDYTNTYYDTSPQLDVCNADTLQPYAGCDFIVCTEILEHVLSAPVVALRNMYECLRPGGCLVVSAPSYDMAETVEKYPTLRSYHSVQIAGRYAVVYETTAGALGFDPEPVFHGGPGSVLEMRLFGHQALLDVIKAAGFASIATIGEEAAVFGATWPRAVERNDISAPLNGSVVVARK